MSKVGGVRIACGKQGKQTSVCCWTKFFLARTTTVVNITQQRLQSGKSLDSGLERLYITLNSLKYNIRIASKLQLARLFPRTLKNYITLQRQVWLDAYTFRNSPPRILITPQSKKHEKWYKNFQWNVITDLYNSKQKPNYYNKKQS